MLGCGMCKNRNKNHQICEYCVGYDHYESFTGKLNPNDIDISAELFLLNNFLPKTIASIKTQGDPKKSINNVIFHDPATVVYWTDGTKTVVKSQGEPYDPEKGLAMAIAKKALGNQGNYYEVFKKWLPKEEKKIETEKITELSCFVCAHTGQVPYLYPCSECICYSKFTKKKGKKYD